MKKKVIYYLRRYGPAEIAGTLGALICGVLVNQITGNRVATAFAGTWGENLGFYGTMIGREIYASHQQHRAKDLPYGLGSFLKNLRNVMLEFGLSETMDSFVLRPFLMYIAAVWITPLAVAIFIGKLAADALFYLLAIFSHEMGQRGL